MVKTTRIVKEEEIINGGTRRLFGKKVISAAFVRELIMLIFLSFYYMITTQRDSFSYLFTAHVQMAFVDYLVQLESLDILGCV